MIVEEYIDHSLPKLFTHDTVAKAMHYIEEYKLELYAVIEGESNYKGLISEGLLYHIDNDDEKVGNLSLEYQDVFVHSSDHFFEVLKKYEQNNLKIIPVLDDEGNFKGVVNLANATDALSKIASVSFEGALIVLSVKEREYSLAEICKIIESNNAKVLCTYIIKNTLSEGKIDVTIKLNKNEISKIISALERYGYEIINQFTHTEIESEDKDRLNILFKYLNI